jgi:hypothetical protein
MARHVFHLPVKEMLSRVDSYELSEWFVYFEMDRKEQERDQKRRDAEAKASSSSSNSNANTPSIPPTF